METKTPQSLFPLIPDKRYLSIGEVSQWSGVGQHVLRYWESVFPQLQPMRRGNRRYYSQKDLEVVCSIYELLREKKYTIDGAQKRLNEKRQNSGLSDNKKIISGIRREMEEILKLLK